jgi:hypothetical protein
MSSLQRMIGMPADVLSKSEESCGNGSLMRILPAVLYFYRFGIEIMLEKVGEISAITHSQPRCRLACIIYALLASALLTERDKHLAYQKMLENLVIALNDKKWQGEAVHFKTIIEGSIVWQAGGKIRSSSYVVDTLEAAIWSFMTSDSFPETVLRAVNLGDDTDTVAAVTGGLAGIYYGDQKIPRAWIEKLARTEAIAALLHDAVEDQGGARTREEIRERFGDKIVGIVDECSNSDVEPTPPWRERKEAYLKHLGDASPAALRISLADKLHNARSIVADVSRGCLIDSLISQTDLRQPHSW